MAYIEEDSYKVLAMGIGKYLLFTAIMGGV